MPFDLVKVRASRIAQSLISVVMYIGASNNGARSVTLSRSGDKSGAPNNRAWLSTIAHGAPSKVSAPTMVLE